MIAKPISFTPKGQATRARLISVAQDVAIVNGGHFELSEVAAAAGVVPSLVHRYFGSKAGLVTALVDDFFARFHAEALDVPLDDKGTWAEHERIRLELGVRFNFAEPFSAILYGPLAREPEVARKEAARIALVVDRAARSIRKGQKRGELPAHIDPGLAGAAMFGAMRQVMTEALNRTPRPTPEAVIDVLWRQVCASVGIDPKSNKPV